MKIEDVEVRVVAPRVKRYTWSYDLPEQFTTNTLVRIRTDDGVEGIGAVSNYTSYDYERYTAETIRHLFPILLGCDPLERETIWHRLRSRPLTSRCGIYWEKLPISQFINCWVVLETESSLMPAHRGCKTCPPTCVWWNSFLNRDFER